MLRRVAVYVRVSTQEQAASGYSIGEQTERLKKYCEAHDWTVVSVYTDPGFSGAKMDRPALQRLLSDAGRGIFDTVLVWKLDRLSRSQRDTMYMVESCFLAGGIDFISMNENFDTSTPFGRAMVGILSVFAQLERDQIRERMTMGRVGRAKSGLYSGCAHPLIGYDYKDGALVPNEYEAMQVRLIFELFVRGLDGRELSYTAIRDYMAERYVTKYGAWKAVNEIKFILTNPVYIGQVSFQGVYYDGVHEPIVSRELWDAAQAAVERRTEIFGNATRKREGQVNLLTGLCFCGKCGRRYTIKTMKHQKAGRYYEYRYYRCDSGREKKAEDRGCKNASFRQDELEGLVLSEIRKLSLDPSLIDGMAGASFPDPENDAAVLSRRIAEVDAQSSRVLDLYQLGTVELSAVSSRLDALKKEKDALLQELAALDTKKPRVSASEAKAAAARLDDVLDGGSDAERQQLVRSLIDRIVLTDETVEIHWGFCL